MSNPIIFPIASSLVVLSLWLCLGATMIMVVTEALTPPKPPTGVSLSFPPFSRSKLTCKIDKSLDVDPDLICKSFPPGEIIFSYDDEVISARYQYKKKVQLWKKGSPYAASFSTAFTLNIKRDAERSVKRVFGGGIAFAITPTIDVGESGPESFGLFKIEDATGKPASGTPNPKTLAVEIDTSRDVTYSWDPQIPHVGLDINSVNSVKSRFLWNGTRFINRKVAVFIDYDASLQEISVRFQNVTTNGKPDKKKSKLFLSYSGLDLAAIVDERSYVGFSSRVPVTTDGVYFLYDWKFSTKWVLRKGIKI